MIAAADFSLAPFPVVGSDWQSPVGLVGGALKHSSYWPGPGVALRAVAMHFAPHLASAPTCLVSALPVLVSHFASSFVRPGTCANAGAATRHRPAAAAATMDTERILSSMIDPLLLVGRGKVARCPRE